MGHHLWSRGIVHGDLEPRHLRADLEPHVYPGKSKSKIKIKIKVIDFGRIGYGSAADIELEKERLRELCRIGIPESE